MLPCLKAITTAKAQRRNDAQHKQIKSILRFFSRIDYCGYFLRLHGIRHCLARAISRINGRAKRFAFAVSRSRTFPFPVGRAK